MQTSQQSAGSDNTSELGGSTGPDSPSDPDGADDPDSAAGPDLGRRLGYVLKQAQSALRSRMDHDLRPLGLTVPQYACLELLRTESLTSAELARGMFVTAQSMNGVVQSLQERGLVARADTAPSGRRRPAALTETGRELLTEADGRVRRIEAQMIGALDPEGADQMVDGLAVIATTLRRDDRG